MVYAIHEPLIGYKTARDMTKYKGWCRAWENEVYVVTVCSALIVVSGHVSMSLLLESQMNVRATPPLPLAIPQHCYQGCMHAMLPNALLIRTFN